MEDCPTSSLAAKLRSALDMLERSREATERLLEINRCLDQMVQQQSALNLNQSAKILELSTQLTQLGQESMRLSDAVRRVRPWLERQFRSNPDFRNAHMVPAPPAGFPSEHVAVWELAMAAMLRSRFAGGGHPPADMDEIINGMNADAEAQLMTSHFVRQCLRDFARVNGLTAPDGEMDAGQT